MERRTLALRRLFSLATPGRRGRAAPGVALLVLPALVAVAASQPVVIRRQLVTQRVDAQAFVVFDTSLSMSAREGATGATRLQRAEREAEAVIPKLGDIPVGLATMTDRVLPVLMPTTNFALIKRTVAASIAINTPPPSRFYRGRATTLQALFSVPNSQLYGPGVTHPILVVFTDGESNPLPTGYGAAIAHELTIPPLFVHVSAPTERIYVHGRIDPRYQPDTASGSVLQQFATDTRGHVFGEQDLGSLVGAIKAEAGPTRAHTTILGYSRIPLGPWFVLAGVVPLGFLFWRRNL